MESNTNSLSEQKKTELTPILPEDTSAELTPTCVTAQEIDKQALSKEIILPNKRKRGPPKGSLNKKTLFKKFGHIKGKNYIQDKSKGFATNNLEEERFRISAKRCFLTYSQIPEQLSCDEALRQLSI